MGISHSPISISVRRTVGFDSEDGSDGAGRAVIGSCYRVGPRFEVGRRNPGCWWPKGLSVYVPVLVAKQHKQSGYLITIARKFHRRWRRENRGGRYPYNATNPFGN